MSFNPEEQAVLAEIVEWTPNRLKSWLSAYGSRIEAETEIRVKAYITEWESIKNTDDVSLYPKESNFGVRLRGDSKVDNIRRWVKLLLEIEEPDPDWIHRLKRA